MLKLLRHQGIFHIDFDCFIKKNHLSWQKCSFELCNPSTVLVALAFCSLMWHPCSINTLFLRLYSTDQCLTVFWKVMLYFFSFRKRGSDRPTADSLAQMLIQALHSQDNSLMEVGIVKYCIHVQWKQPTQWLSSLMCSTCMLLESPTEANMKIVSLDSPVTLWNLRMTSI